DALPISGINAGRSGKHLRRNPATGHAKPPAQGATSVAFRACAVVVHVVVAGGHPCCCGFALLKNELINAATRTDHQESRQADRHGILRPAASAAPLALCAVCRNTADRFGLAGCKLGDQPGALRQRPRLTLARRLWTKVQYLPYRCGWCVLQVGHGKSLSGLP